MSSANRPPREIAACRKNGEPMKLANLYFCFVAAATNIHRTFETGATFFGRGISYRNSSNLFRASETFVSSHIHNSVGPLAVAKKTAGTVERTER